MENHDRRVQAPDNVEEPVPPSLHRLRPLGQAALILLCRTSAESLSGGTPGSTGTLLGGGVREWAGVIPQEEI